MFQQKLHQQYTLCCIDIITDDSRFVAGTNQNTHITRDMFIRTGDWVV